ncbi:MAG: hypothetical protein V8T01_12160 [Oscillospiraceae bacterium]
MLKVVVGAGIEHGVDDDGVPCLHFAGGMGKAALERLPDGIVIGAKRDAVRRGADDAVRVELLRRWGELAARSRLTLGRDA